VGVSESEQLYPAAFEIMNFCEVEASRLCWIYSKDWLLSLSYVDQTTLLYRANLFWVPNDEEVVRPAPQHATPHCSQAGPSSSSQPPLPDYSDL